MDSPKHEYHGLLNEAANESYERHKKNKSSWYKPVVDYDDPTMTAEEKHMNPRYCNGRFKRWEFIMLHVIILLNIALVIFLPILYFELVPWYAQYTLDHPGQDRLDIKLHQVALTQMDDVGMGYLVNLSLPSLTGLPLKAGFYAMNISLQTKQGNELLHLSLPTQDYWLNQPVDVFAQGRIDFTPEAQSNVQSLLQELKDTENFDDFEVVAHFQLPARVFDMTMYWPGIPLHKTVKFDTFGLNSKFLLDLLNKQKENEPTEPAEPLYDVPEEPSVLFKEYSSLDIMSPIKGLDVLWSKLDLSIEDQGPRTAAEMTLFNQLPLSLVSIEDVSFYLGLQGTRILKVTTNTIGLEQGLQTLNTEIKVDFLGDMLDPQMTKQKMEEAIKSYSEQGDVEVDLMGPFHIQGADFLEMTEPFTFRIHYKDLLEVLKKNETQSLDQDKIMDLLGNSTIKVDIKDSITIPLHLSLDAFLKIPRKISFPYATGISIYGGDVKTIESGVSGIEIQRTDEHILVDTKVEIKPQNSNAAAKALADAVNPIVSINPQSSSVNLKDVYISALNSEKKTFAFIQEIFKDSPSFVFTLPALTCDDCMIPKMLSAPPSKKPSPIKIRGIDVAQMTQSSGFQAKGTVDVAYPDNLPRIELSMGFFHIDAHVEDTKMIGLELPVGLEFNSGPTNINALALIHRDQLLASKAQSLVNAFLLDAAPPSYMGTVGLLIGASSGHPVVTFSQIDVQLSSSVLAPILKGKSDSGSLTDDLPDKMVVVDGVDVKLSSSQQLNIAVANTITNNYNVSLSMGTIVLETLLQDSTLMNVELSPISLKRGVQGMNLGVNLLLSDGSNGMDAHVATLVNSVLSKSPSNMLLGVKGFVLYPPGVGSGSAVIDQFAPVKVQLSADKLTQSSSSSSSSSRLLDTSKVMPSDTSELVDAMNPLVKDLSLETLAGSRLNVDASFDYTNPLPISIHFPYFAITSNVASLPAVQLELSGLILNRKNGNMKPLIHMTFPRNEATPGNIGNLFNNFLQGSVNPGVGVSGIYFGTSPSDKNHLLGLVNADLTSKAQEYGHKGIEIKDALSTKLHDILQSSSNEAAQGPGLINLNGPMNTSVAVTGLNVEFKPSSLIDIGIPAHVASLFPLKVSVPFLTVGADVDTLQMMNLVTGISLEKSSMNVESRIIFNDIDPVADKIAELTDAFISKKPVSGSLGGGRLRLGISPEDHIDTFSKISLAFNADPIFTALENKLAQKSTTSKSPSLMEKISLKMQKANLEAQQDKTIKVDASAQLNSSLPITLKGLGYYSAFGGLDNVEMVGIKGNGISLVTGEQPLALDLTMSFPSSSEAQNKVASFSENLKNQFGSTSEYITASKIRFGVSESDHIKILSKAKLGVKSGAIINDDLLDHFKTSKQSTVGLDINKMVSLNNASIEFYPSSSMSASLSSTLHLDFPLSVNLPFVAFGASINDREAFDFKLNGLVLSPEQPTMFLKNDITVFDSDEMANDMRDIAHAISHSEPVPGKAGGGFIRFGLSESDSIDTFAKLSASFTLNKIMQVLNDRADGLPALNQTDLMEQLGLELTGASLETKPHHTLSASVTAGFHNNFSVSIQGLGFMTASLGLDQLDVVQVSSSSSFFVKPGQNNISAGVDLMFPSSEDIQNKVAEFTSELINQGAGKTKQDLFASKISFGYNQEHAFKFLSKVELSMPSSKVVTQDLIDSLLAKATSKKMDTSLLDKLVIHGARMDASKANIVDVGAQVTLTNTSFDAQINIGYAAASTLVNGSRLVDIALTSGFKVGQSQGNISVDLQNQLIFHDSESLQYDLATIVNQVLKESPTSGWVGVAGAVFGYDSSPEHVIDTFRKCTIATWISEILKLKSKLSAPIQSSSLLDKIKYDITKAELDVYNETSLLVDVGLRVDMENVYVNLPFLRIDAAWDDKAMSSVQIMNTKLENKSLDNSVVVDVKENDELWFELMDHLYYFLFHHPKNVSSTLSVSGFSFGASEQEAYKGFSRVNVGANTEEAFRAAQNYSDTQRPIVIQELLTQMDPNGILGTFKCKPMSSAPTIVFKTRSLEAALLYQVNGTAPVSTLVDATFNDITMVKNEPLFGRFLLAPRQDYETGLVPALQEALPKVLAFEDYAQNARLGFLKFVGSQGTIFRPLQRIFFRAPDLYFFHPLNVSVNLQWPELRKGLGLPFEIDLGMYNNGPLHLDLAGMGVSITDSQNKEFLHAESKGPVIVLNENEGGTTPKNPVNGKFKAWLNYHDVNPFNFVPFIRDLLKKKIMVKTQVIRDGAHVAWIEKVLTLALTPPVIEKITSNLNKTLENVNLKVLGFPIHL